MMRRTLWLIAILLCAASVRAADGPNGSYVKADYVLFPIPASVNPMVVTDANGYLVVKNNSQTAPLGPARPMSNTPLTTDSNNYLMVSCSGCATAPLTLAQADNAQTLIFSTATYTSDMSSKPTFSIIATENTSAGTHDYLKMAITKTAGSFNFLDFFGGVAGTTSEFVVDSSGNLTTNGSLTLGSGANLSISGSGFQVTGSSGLIQSTGSVANAARLTLSGSSNTGADATTAYSLAHTLNTSGVPSVFKVAVTDTAHGAGTKIVDVLGGSAATTRLFSVDTAGQIIQAGVSQVLFVASNFTTAANTNLQTITGLTAALPASFAVNVPFTCKILWSQATAAVAVSFGVQSDTLAPTSFSALGQMETNLTVTSYGDVQALNTTTATAVVTGTPATTATIFNAYIDGFLENPSGALTNLNIMVKTATAADAVTVYRGSFCRLF